MFCLCIVLGCGLMLLPMEPRSVDCAKGPAQHSHDQQPLSELKADVARQKQRETKKFSKAVQAERTKEKAQQKKANISDITRLRKQRQKSVSLQLKHLSTLVNILLASDSSTCLAVCRSIFDLLKLIMESVLAMSVFVLPVTMLWHICRHLCNICHLTKHRTTGVYIWLPLLADNPVSHLSCTPQQLGQLARRAAVVCRALQGSLISMRPWTISGLPASLHSEAAWHRKATNGGKPKMKSLVSHQSYCACRCCCFALSHLRRMLSYKIHALGESDCHAQHAIQRSFFWLRVWRPEKADEVQ